MKNIPERMCVGCKQMKWKYELIRFTRLKDLSIIKIDRYFKFFGRGVYICKNNECLNKARRKKAFEKAFKQNISKDFYVDLEGIIKHGFEED